MMSSPSLNGGEGGHLDFEARWRRLDSPQCVQGPAMLSSSEDFGDLSEMFTTEEHGYVVHSHPQGTVSIVKLLSLQE